MKKIIPIICLAITSCLASSAQERHLLVLHTSDTHSCVEPVSRNFSDTAQADKGGFLRRAALIKQLRKERPELLLLDCGDFSQGSAYYNLYHGEVEVKLMNAMGYDACTIGNHEFDFGLDNLARLIRMADFPFVCCNYDFTGTPCEGLVKPYMIIERAGVRVGILGVCPQPDGLVTKSNYEPMKYTDPAVAAQPVINLLRNQEHCDLVICLSHLGLAKGKGYDEDFIARTTGIDLLLGGHTHTYLSHPAHAIDKAGHEVMIDHMGKNGRFVGSMDITLAP
ncbi:MAG TPA: metallophosphatase [Prevotellaceae bacterium]|nr:metallophosphatase [Prevotellaceae bacterium]